MSLTYTKLLCRVKHKKGLKCRLIDAMSWYFKLWMNPKNKQPNKQIVGFFCSFVRGFTVRLWGHYRICHKIAKFEPKQWLHLRRILSWNSTYGCDFAKTSNQQSLKWGTLRKNAKTLTYYSIFRNPFCMQYCMQNMTSVDKLDIPE